MKLCFIDTISHTSFHNSSIHSSIHSFTHPPQAVLRPPPPRGECECVLCAGAPRGPGVSPPAPAPPKAQETEEGGEGRQDLRIPSPTHRRRKKGKEEVHRRGEDGGGEEERQMVSTVNVISILMEFYGFLLPFLKKKCVFFLKKKGRVKFIAHKNFKFLN